MDERTISQIEEFGCSVVNVAQTSCGLGWSYTIGIFDTTGKPEIITVGLLPETAHHAWIKTKAQTETKTETSAEEVFSRGVP